MIIKAKNMLTQSQISNMTNKATHQNKQYIVTQKLVP